MDKLTPEKIEELRGLLAKATPGPWEADEEKNEGCYGVGDDCHEGFQSASIHAPDGRGGSAKLFDALNSDAACVEEEYDEDRHYAWDGVSRINAALIVAMRNALPALLASLASKDAEIERQAQALREMTFSRDTWRKTAEGRGPDLERETKIARAAEARIAAALAALEEARVYLATLARFLNVHAPTLAKLNALEGNEDG